MSRRRASLPAPSSWRRGPGTFYVALDITCSACGARLARVGRDTADAAGINVPWWCEGFDPVIDDALQLRCDRCRRSVAIASATVDEQLRSMWKPRRLHVDTIRA